MKPFSQKRDTVTALLLTGSLLAGCAAPLRPVPLSADSLVTPVHAGRISLQVQQEPAPQSFIASFELMGNAENGLLRLFSPLGSTLATARWTPGHAILLHNGSERSFSSLDARRETLTGAPLPAAALLDWMNGRNTAAAGWEADLSQYPQGKIRAQRLQPPPLTTLQVVLQ